MTRSSSGESRAARAFNGTVATPLASMLMDSDDNSTELGMPEYQMDSDPSAAAPPFGGPASRAFTALVGLASAWGR